MTLPPGTIAGRFEILAPLGAGGMGEVVRARDTRLGRTVAIKSLPLAFAGDPARLERFEREARLLASLDHANIAGIHGIEDVGGSPFLVLEFVEGETLAQRLARGPLTVRETLEVGAQIASAIDAAHERGIVHRDLKPGNVMLTASGTVKVLDFGLAKDAGAGSASSSSLSTTPTQAMSATGAGVILGTAPYMSPEQARGKVVDRRADVWAFGCILFECLTGQQTFAGETVSDVIARILERDPDWSALPAASPPRLRDVMRRCLIKDPAERPRDIGDLGRELAAIANQPPGGPAAQAGAHLPSLAVLYFENLNNDSESEYFCAGITEDILTDLSKIKALRVASRNAVARYRGTAADLPKVAAELGVGAVLEGSVRRAGDRVRITAQLIDAASGFHLWAERYDRTLQDVFAVQEEIASSIAEALRVALTPIESQSIGRDRPKDARAYDLYLKGRDLYGHYTKESLDKALDLFREAIAIDPDYALAWAGVADCYGQLGQWNMVADQAEMVRLGLEAARKAAAIEPKLAEAYKAEALVLRLAGDADGVRVALGKALEVNPRFLPALVNLAVRSFCDGDLAGAERLNRRALELDPQEGYAMIWVCVLLIYTDRFDEAERLARQLYTISDNPFYINESYSLRCAVHIAKGEEAMAAQIMREGASEGFDPTDRRGVEALLAVRAGRHEEARRLLEEMEAIPSLSTAAISDAAVVAVRLGEPQRAARLFDRPITRDMSPTMIRMDRELHPLLDLDPAHRRSDQTLVWPLEAPMIDAARHALFREVRIESGVPKGSDPRMAR